eukprot:TRINITY_DN76934_c0_g1_i1.p2 TRINITY_DN76934_c0_g1~~TRINITY_DN76934_c0_g1_i1.p2  ORF type:complete len:169 (-),score=10.36 TRINITY_DN76934_c0_g1_i1:55-561(-)
MEALMEVLQAALKMFSIPMRRPPKDKSGSMNVPNACRCIGVNNVRIENLRDATNLISRGEIVDLTPVVTRESLRKSWCQRCHRTRTPVKEEFARVMNDSVFNRLLVISHGRNATSGRGAVKAVWSRFGKTCGSEIQSSQHGAETSLLVWMSQVMSPEECLWPWSQVQN